MSIMDFVERSGRFLKATFRVGLLLVFIATSDAQTWKSLGLAGENITAIAVDPSSNSRVIYAGSDFFGPTNGAIFKTVDGGTTWDTLLTWMSVERIIVNDRNPSIVYVNTGRGMMKTTDAGLSWALADSGIRFSLYTSITDFALDQEHPETLYAVTYDLESEGGIYRSTNGGRYWSSADTTAPWFWIPTASGDSTKTKPFLLGSTVVALDPWNSERVYAGTAWTAYLMKSWDGAATWAYAGLSDNTSLFTSIAFGRGSNEIFVSTSIGPTSHVYYSFNAGSTWKTVRSGGKMGMIQSQRVYGVLDTELNVFVTCIENGKLGNVYRSTDEGTTWLSLGGSGNGTLCLFGDKLYVGGDGIMVGDSVLTGITKTVAACELASVFRLNQNYPNPFNPSTIIDFQLGKGENISLEIYDILGRKIKTLIHGYQNAGVHSVTFNASDLSSGPYFCRLTAGSFVDTKSLMILK